MISYQELVRTFPIDLLPAKLCNCTQAIMTHIITSFLAFMFF
ncbi:hypothetical protein [Escherichia coli]